MTDFPPPLTPTTERYKNYRPWLTITCCLAAVVLFIGINLEPSQESWVVFRKWGSPAAEDIWNGAYWGLITSNFLHIAIWHIAFNLYWFFLLGRKVEFQNTPLFFGLFLFFASMVSSLSELAFGGTTGIGLSGVVYALFGYILARSRTEEAYKGFIERKTVQWFLGWLLLCMALTELNIWQVGNAAHVGGFVWGLLLGFVANRRTIIRFGLPVVVLLLLSSTLFYLPWSTAWLESKAYTLLKAQKIDEAEAICNSILKKNEYNEFAIANLKEIRVNRLCKQAYAAHVASRYAEGKKLYEKVLLLDSANTWAKENMALLPQGTFIYTGEKR